MKLFPQQKVLESKSLICNKTKRGCQKDDHLAPQTPIA